MTTPQKIWMCNECKQVYSDKTQAMFPECIGKIQEFISLDETIQMLQEEIEKQDIVIRERMEKEERGFQAIFSGIITSGLKGTVVGYEWLITKLKDLE